ncbi:MAG: hypothetical protein KME04_20575 [Pleurocapsa minor GSE-CHR-MK-17-07R]|jgi:hypothetical protein|nr:hypothetical protein [Pleurocapsa minor GSE-CHR-MK 17-07R]
MLRFVFVCLMLFSTLSSAAHAQQDAETRLFRMGFTPFPYEISIPAVLSVYERIAEDGDLIAHHFDNGVPWTEALSGEPFSDHLLDDWNLRLGLTPPELPVLATVTPINFFRNGLAGYHGDAEDMPLPAPFDSYSFDHPDVISAFIAYSESVIEAFQPDYFLFGIEVNLLMKMRPDLWDDYMVLHRDVYTTLKTRHPDLPLMVSVTGIDLVPGYTEANNADQQRALADIVDYTDVLALSVYPYMTAYMTNAIPYDLIDQIAALTDLPLAISETGYPAQPFAIMNQGIRLEFTGTPALQAEWMAHVLERAQAHEMRYVINFVLQDYDAIWEMVGAQEDISIAWRDTGLYDETGAERPALAAWRDWLSRPLSPPG